MTYKNNNIIPEIFASIIAVVAGILIYVSRLGFDNYGTLIIKTIFVSFFLIYTPHFVKAKILGKPSKEWYFSKSFILFICIILLVLAGQTSINLGIDLSSLFSLLGGVIFIATIIDSKKNGYSPISLLLFMLFIFF